ncbi:MAG: TonB-dependent receptor [Bacteroidia bacterium]|nr:TonB-dependent receptor [Bacteroidia bacterium]
MNTYKRQNFRLHASLFIFLLAIFSGLQAQYPGAPGGFGGGGGNMNIGRFYGKVVDENGKGIAYANVQLTRMQMDTVAKKMTEKMITGQLTAANGDFNLEKLPIMGDFTLKISYIGYASTSQTVSFGLKPPTGGMPGPPAGGGFPAGGFAGASFEKDLGNLELAASGVTLDTVTVTAEIPVATLALDKKVYRVDKDASIAGGNAQDALKNVPSLSVDIDGNVALRNGSPQIFVDGRPTTLSLDQIAADAIESVEVITNPSAKFDAGGGTAGIVNIVLKKERRLGYNGNIRTGINSRGGYNAGGDINARGEKINVFASGNFNRNLGYSVGETFRQNLFGSPYTNLTQIVDGRMDGFFANGRAGVDWFLDNRNTLTFSGSYTRGKFGPEDEITSTTDFLYPDSTVTSEYVRTSLQDRNFRNIGGSLLFKHLFPKEGAEWTADLNYNRVQFLGTSDYSTEYDDGRTTLEQQNGTGNGQFITVQSDFVNPINSKMKLEGGVRAALRINSNDIENTYYDPLTGQWVVISSFADNYKFNDDVYAAYGQFSHQFKTWGYQAGLRAESSIYSGELIGTDSSFTIAYPLSFFPSLFLTKKLNETDNVQFAYTRRVNRPNFFQTMPFTDFSDSLNLRRGNPQLRPEFVNSLEVSYQKIFSKGHNLLVSVYYKQATDLITSYLVNEYNDELGREVVVSTYANSNSSQAYGTELTLKNNFLKKIDLTTNLNIYQSRVDASNVETDLVVNQLSWFLKENLQISLPGEFMIQFSGEYRSRAAFTPSSGNQMPWGMTSTNTAQGYTLENWFLDISIRKNFLDRKATLTLNVNDVFRTRRSGTYTASDIFIQDSWRIRDPQIFRLNFSYRFGKMDASLFKRKNMKMNNQGMDMM